MGKLSREVYEKVEKVREPLSLRPARRDQKDPHVLAATKLVQDLPNDCERRKGVGLQTVPLGHESVLLPSAGIRKRRHVNWEFCVQACGEKVDYGRPPQLEQKSTDVWMKGPLRRYHLS